MNQYSSYDVKLSNSRLDKIKSGIKNSTEVTLNLSSIRLIFHINYYLPIEKFQDFVKLMQSILLSTLLATLLRNLLADKGVKTKAPKEGDIKAGKRTIRADEDFLCRQILWHFFENIFKTNLNLVVFIQEMIKLK